MKTHHFERGQALVLIILAIVGMLGFAALAVDVGRVFAERRRAQNATDAAALAAALAGADGKSDADAQNAAISSLQMNDYTDLHPNSDDGTKLEIEVNIPPVSPNIYAGQSGYYQVIIHQQVDPVFAQFVYSGLLKFTVEAVANTTSAHNIFEGSALVATSPDECKALWIANKRGTNIENGNAYSLSSAGTDPVNGCVPGEISGPQSCASGERSGSGLITVDNGFNIITHGPWRDESASGGVVQAGTNPPVHITPEECGAVSPVPVLKPPLCDDLPVQTVDSGNNITLHPGRYFKSNKNQ